MRSILIIGSLTLLTLSCEMESSKKKEPRKEKTTTEACTDSCCDKGKDSPVLACKLTTPELQKRKETVLASLRKQVIKKKELKNGYAFTFKGTDAMIDELTEFVKTERMCCDFFTFNISVKGDQSETVLEITGVEGAKEFITSELEL
jgi:hypothetical protein